MVKERCEEPGNTRWRVDDADDADDADGDMARMSPGGLSRGAMAELLGAVHWGHVAQLPMPGFMAEVHTGSCGHHTCLPSSTPPPVSQ